MNILIQLSHPAHFHLYKHVASNLMNDGHKVFILIKTKDVLEDLLKAANLPYYNILQTAHRKTKLGVLMDMLIREAKMIRFSRRNKIDILTGSTPEVAHVAWLMRKRAINTGEDDMAVVPAFAKIAGPFIQTILSPTTCDNGRWNKKTIHYPSYHELAYLHPNHFSPDRNIVERYGIDTTKPYFIVRFAQLNAHHDVGIKGINADIAQRIIDMLTPHGRVLITSERTLEPQFEQYRMAINPLDIHHVMSFASLYIGDSQTMAAEAGVLGVPFIRYNGFVGRIGYLDELERKYKLGFGVRPELEPIAGITFPVKYWGAENIYAIIDQLLSLPNIRDEFQMRRQTMLNEKIDYAKFLTWFVDNYPQSAQSAQRADEAFWQQFK